MVNKKAQKELEIAKAKKRAKLLMAKKIACVVVICAIILSTLLVFFIPPWAVLIINGGAIVLYRIFFRKLQFSAIGGALLYLLVGLFAAGVVALVMLYPEKICGGVLQNADADELSKYNERLIGSCWVFAIIYLLQGIWVIVDAVRTRDVLLPCHCVVPVSLMGGLMIYLMTSLFVWMIYVFVVHIANILSSVLSEEDGAENWGGSSGGGGGSDTYDIIIIKH